MKNILLYLSIIMSMLMTACSNEDMNVPAPKEVETEKECTYTFEVKVPDMTSTSRALTGDASDIQTFKLLVFDADTEAYLYERTATLTEVNEDGGEFTVNLISTDEPRIIHFVATHAESLNVPYQMTEFAVLSQLHVSDNDAYWQRKEFRSIKEDTQLSPANDPIVMVRNVARITVKSESGINLQGFALGNTPSHGSVAPYYMQADDEGNYFPNYITTNGVNSYDALVNAGYTGVPYRGTLSDAPSASDFNKEPKYMYERTQEENPAYVIVKINNKYHKLDILRKNETTGTNEYYKIFRNFSYDITITGMDNSAAGYNTPADAAANVASNNLTVSMELKDLTNIAYGDERLFVSKTEVVWTTDEDLTFKFKYTVDGEEANDEVKFFFGDAKTTQGDVYDGKGYEVSKNVDSDGYSTITIPTTGLVERPAWKEQEVLVTAGSLSRTVNLILIEPYQLTNVRCNPETVSSSLNQEVNVYFTLPNGLPESIFPLTFILAPEAHSITPTGGDMPVVSLLNHSNTTLQGVKYGFEKVIEWEDYDASNGTTVTCAFKTNMEASATDIHIYNEYFEFTKTSFANSSSGGGWWW